MDNMWSSNYPEASKRKSSLHCTALPRLQHSTVQYVIPVLRFLSSMSSAQDKHLPCTTMYTVNNTTQHCIALQYIAWDRAECGYDMLCYAMIWYIVSFSFFLFAYLLAYLQYLHACACGTEIKIDHDLRRCCHCVVLLLYMCVPFVMYRIASHLMATKSRYGFTALYTSSIDR